MFYLNSTLNFGILPVLVFQLEVYYKVDRLLTGLPAQRKGTTARWYSNKTSLLLLGNGTTCLPNVIYVKDFKIIMYHLEDIKYRYINDDKANHWPIKGLKIEKKNHLSPGNHPLLFGWCFHLHCSGSCHRHASLGCWGYVLQKERQQAYGYFYRG